ncbi:lactate dehydrogenase-like 2-hydroxyacid dehydrogenase [Micromonospora sp. Llam0]|uniref:NAD(P)-dependent oxidoreductase n=1 Tax=Micromonospora sp. Llam0 TaxID=2485143 RepID=UPI000F499E58|nr:NAD(P)-dependent oxidoreductase [Micromonospora sp. Llam0]ROO51404.1 lactate dehydrogenase-like 2-hydroxyacid dehydrogenase [Micromonospora sp. Llam0]
MRPRIFVTQPIPQPALELLREHGHVEVFPWTNRDVSLDELESASVRSHYLFCMHETPIRASLFGPGSQLVGIGYSGPDPELHDLEAIASSGVRMLTAVRPSPPDDDPDGFSWDGYGLNPRATGQLMVALLLNCAYRVNESDMFCRANGFFQEMTMQFMGHGTTGKTVGLYGFGKVAKQAARLLSAMDMEVLYTKRTRLTPADEAKWGVQWVADADDLITRSDYVCLLVNYTADNAELFGEREFKLMKPTAYFINVARGRLVDEQALIAALRDGTIAGAGLEAFRTEPPVVHDAYVPAEFRKMDNVVLTPHNGGATYASRGAQTLRTAEAIVADIKANWKN